MSVAERAEQQVLRPRVRPQDDASYLGRGRLVAAPSFLVCHQNLTLLVWPPAASAYNPPCAGCIFGDEILLRFSSP
jgi:hypothetical protein